MIVTYSDTVTSSTGITLSDLTAFTVLSFTNAYMLKGDCHEWIEWNDTPDQTTLTYNLGN